MKRATTNLLKIVLVGIVAGFTFSSTAQAWWNNEWTIRKKIIIDTSAAGGAISDPIGTTPVLIARSAGVAAAPRPWSEQARKRTRYTAYVIVALSWIFQLHRYGFL